MVEEEGLTSSSLSLGEEREGGMGSGMKEKRQGGGKEKGGGGKGEGGRGKGGEREGEGGWERGRES